MSSIEKRLRDELGELASWLIDRRAESSSVEQADSGSDSIPRDSGADSIPRLDLDADTVRSGGRGRLVRVAAVLVLIVGLVGASGLLSEDAPSVVTVPADPASQTPTTSVPTSSVPPTTTVDDLSTDDPGDESLLVELAPEVDPDVPPPGPLDESSIRDEEWLKGPSGVWYGPWFETPQGVPWLVPWGDGFLQIGYLNTSEQVPTEMNLYAQTSDDGLNWGQPFLLDLPREHFDAPEIDNNNWSNSFWPIIKSNGTGLVILSQLPGRYFGERGANAALGRQNAPAGAHVEQRVFVSVTDNLESWNQYEYPLLPPDGVHKSLANHVVAEDVIVSDEGWMIQISTLTYMDIGLLVPAEIREAVEEMSWSLYDDDGMYVGYNVGLLVKWIVNTNSGLSELHRKLFSWEELGITRTLFEDYGLVYNKPYHFSHRYSGSLLVVRWGEDPVRTELAVNGFCCEVISTDGSYIGLSQFTEPGYPPDKVWGILMLSSDGLTWQSIDSPADKMFRNLEYCILWPPSVRSVEAGVVMYSHGEINNSCTCDSERFVSEFFWTGDDKASNWESQNISDNPCHESYRVAKSVGKGILIDTYVPVDYSEEPDTWDERYHSTIVSIDGKNWFTFYEESDPEESSVAFNGNVAVRVDNAGNSYRYELQ